ncbi:MmgE/PrpD family protein [Microbacterium sp. X-17]|uniref:MmgE/PrpD family protein n=1 Tax=Microbacterium sp. X-17 TaxID=3144404 RepID=UPI0031F5C160
MNAPASVTGVTVELAEFAVRTDPLPPHVLAAARALTAGTLARMTAGADAPAVRIARAALGSDAVTLAALLGGLAARAGGDGPAHPATGADVGAPIVPAARALGAHLGRTEDAIVEAVGFGAEVALRVGVALGAWHRERGWDVTGTTGRIGAAAACARLLGLGAEQTTHALGIATTEAAGLLRAADSMTGDYHAGKAAYDGVEAALLASAGFTSARTAIEGVRGLLVTTSKDADPTPIVDGLGDRWELTALALGEE